MVNAELVTMMTVYQRPFDAREPSVAQPPFSEVATTLRLPVLLNMSPRFFAGRQLQLAASVALGTPRRLSVAEQMLFFHLERPLKIQDDLKMPLQLSVHDTMHKVCENKRGNLQSCQTICQLHGSTKQQER